MNDMSGSRGEANFVWRCKMCKVYITIENHAMDMFNQFEQRESSATIMAAPISYQQASPPTTQKVIDFDCRGLEFTEFKPEVYTISCICIRMAL